MFLSTTKVFRYFMDTNLFTIRITLSPYIIKYKKKFDESDRKLQRMNILAGIINH